MVCGRLLCCCFFAILGNPDKYSDTQTSNYLDGSVELAQVRPVHPTVEISNALPGSPGRLGPITSSDDPVFWNVVPYGRLDVAVNVPSYVGEIADKPTNIALFLDGQQVDARRFDNAIQAGELDSAGRVITSFNFHFDCPAPGRHVIQARYLTNNLWSELSSPLYFQIRYPEPPRIIGVAGSGNFGGPITNEPIKVKGDPIRIKLANVPNTGSTTNNLVAVYLDGELVGKQPVSPSSCCVSFNIANAVVPGIYQLTVRSIPGGTGCSLASQPSKPVAIHYVNENAYLLRPGEGCQAKPGYCNPETSASSENLEFEFEPVGQTSSIRGQIQLTSFVQDDFQDQAAPGEPASQSPESNEPQEPANDAEADADSGNQNDDAEAVVDPIFVKAEKAVDTAKQNNGRVVRLASQAKKLERAIKSLETSSKQAAQQSGQIVELAKKEADQANAWLAQTRLGHPDIHKAAQAIAANTTASYNKAASINFDDKLTKTNDLFSSALQSLVNVKKFAARSQNRANKVNQNLDVVRELLQNNDQTNAQQTADKSRSLANSIISLIDDVTREVAVLRDLHEKLRHANRGIWELRNEVKLSADLVSQYADEIQNAAIRSATRYAYSIADSYEQMVQEVQKSELSISATMREYTHATLAESESAQNALLAEEHVKSALNVLDSARSNASKTRIASENSSNSQRYVVTGNTQFEAMERSYHAILRQIQAVRTQALMASTHAQLAKSFFDKSQRLKPESKILLDKVATANKNAAMLAAAGDIKSVKDLATVVSNLKIKFFATTGAAANAIHNSKIHSSKAIRWAKDAANSSDNARIRSASISQFGMNMENVAKHAAADANAAVARSANVEIAEIRTKNSALEEYEAKKLARLNALAARSTSMALAASRIDLNLPQRSDVDAEKRTFYFAAPAHFPIRDFGPRGELHEREGATIFEDMSFSFNENGKYKIEYRVETPDLPTNLQLQFKIQSRPNGPWYTLTMRHRYIDPGKIGVREVHPIILEGNSEILKRCFGSICDIRRTGSARFGFGVTSLDHHMNMDESSIQW